MLKEKSTLPKGEDFMFENVTLNWCKLGDPVSEFGMLQWGAQMYTRDEEQARDWRDKNLNVKQQEDGSFVVNIKRKAQNVNGTEKEPPIVVDKRNHPIDVSRLMIANGSEGNVIAHVFPYVYNNKSGYSASLNGIQFTNLVEYKPGLEFSSIVDDEEEEETPAAFKDIF